ncbi:histidine ammonia-lyase [Bacteroidia bacterium]|nr:histidine ammonia-lyase [Bacteroidia bacterium]
MQENYTLDEALLALESNVVLDDATRERMERSVTFLKQHIEKSTAPIYGINTGFGSLQNVGISQDELEELQENLLITHASGVGELLSEELTRIMMWLKMLNMSKGHSGIRPVIFERLALMYNEGVIPCVTEQGSLGASGDLAPLSQMSLPLIGKGRVRIDGQIMDSDQWLSSRGLSQITLHPKEALALINGTQFMLAHAIQAYSQIKKIEDKLPWITSLSLDAFDCRLEPFHPAIHDVRPHAGQIRAAAEIRSILDDSETAQLPKKQVQDPYSFRCVPQVHGASYDALAYCFSVWEVELNSVTDNPSVFEEESTVLSGGNFHGQPLALTLDYAAMAVAEFANISERRTYLLVGGQRDLPAYLAEKSGTDSGMMIAQYTAAALVSQNKQLCTPASVDSIVSSNGQEDHVSMGANAATKLLRVVENTLNALSIEWLTACKAMNVRSSKTGTELQKRFTDFVQSHDLNHRSRPMQDLIKDSYIYCWER